MEDFKKLEAGGAIKVIQSDTIKVYYAELPVIDLSVRYLVRITEPVEMIPVEKRFHFNPLTGTFNASKEGSLELLKMEVLAEWKKMFKGQKRKMKSAGAEWMLQVNKVELIECDLLVPKKV